MAARFQIDTGGRKKEAEGHWKPPKTNTRFFRFELENILKIVILDFLTLRQEKTILA